MRLSGIQNRRRAPGSPKIGRLYPGGDGKKGENQEIRDFQNGKPGSGHQTVNFAQVCRGNREKTALFRGIATASAAHPEPLPELAVPEPVEGSKGRRRLV